jgi:glycosyltransferase involved in cell wall biosynthesis
LSVRTVETIPLRNGRLIAAPAWLRQERRYGTATTWLAHGYTAGRLLLDAGLASSRRLHCLPLVGVLTPVQSQSRAAARASTRARLGLAPGARLILASTSENGSWPAGAGRWQRDLTAARRPDLALMQISPLQPPGSYEVSHAITGQSIDTLPLYALLAACDLFVTDSRELSACAPAVNAAEWGIPVLATANDSAAELVLTRSAGTVVRGGDSELARAVLEELDTGLLRRATTGAVPDAASQIAEFARALLGTYRRMLRAAVIGGAA